MSNEDGSRIGVIETPRAHDVSIVDINGAGWEVRFSPEPRFIKPELVEQGLGLVTKWVNHFPVEDTWIQRTHGIPSPIVKIDATVVNGQLQPYEIEDRPAGMGYSGMVNPDLKDAFAEVVKTWGPFKVVISPNRDGTDDHLWAPRLDVDETERNSRVLVRAEPWEVEFHHLEDQSISTVKAEGDKSYGEKMGLWKRSTASDFDPKRFDKPFVYKGLQGSKGHTVHIYIPKSHADVYGIPKKDFGKHGIVTRGKMEGHIADTPDGFYIQEFHPPMETGIPGNRFMLYRMFYGYDMNTGEWKYVGGTWNARDSLKIHGASDTLNGALVVADNMPQQGEIVNFTGAKI